LKITVTSLLCTGCATWGTPTCPSGKGSGWGGRSKSPNRFCRIFWFVAFASALAFASYYITNIFEKWNENPVLVAFNPTDATFNEIPFPAITICNMNQVKREEAERILKQQ
jgi:hypothetical protein